MPDQLRFDDWDRIVDEFERFGARSVTTGSERVRLEFERAHVSVSRDGQFEAGMALHAVDGQTAETVTIDHEGETITFVGPSFEYTFRRPGSRTG